MVVQHVLYHHRTALVSCGWSLQLFSPPANLTVEEESPNVLRQIIDKVLSGINAHQPNTMQASASAAQSRSDARLWGLKLRSRHCIRGTCGVHVRGHVRGSDACCSWWVGNLCVAKFPRVHSRHRAISTHVVRPQQVACISKLSEPPSHSAGLGVT